MWKSKTGLVQWIVVALVLSACGGFARSEIRLDGTATAVDQITTCSHAVTPVEAQAGQPLVILVHGCRSSAGKFAALADVYATLGMQTLCFSYNDRTTIRRSAQQLATSLHKLVETLAPTNLTLVAHSQGGLVARHALSDQMLSAKYAGPSIELATVSSPFGGVQAAAHCGLVYLGILSLGATSGICQLITGSDWHEINPYASFVQQPAQLHPAVQRHLAIYTDERGTCRSYDSTGQCQTDDFVFSLQEQRNPTVEDSATTFTLPIGHSAVVGNEDTRPMPLVRLLQQQGLMPDTMEQQALQSLLQRVYQ